MGAYNAADILNYNNYGRLWVYDYADANLLERKPFIVVLSKLPRCWRASSTANWINSVYEGTSDNNSN
jgi:hypothetical protein